MYDYREAVKDDVLEYINNEIFFFVFVSLGGETAHSFSQSHRVPQREISILPTPT